MHEAQPQGALIQDRYTILDVLGQGGSGLTYRAEDAVTGRSVALKELSLKGLSDWKKLELFEREALVLKSLDHPAIPQYIDYFQVDTADNRLFYIAQEIAEGHSLAELVAAGERFSEAEVKRIATEVLQVLQYIHQLNPPIIHRDVKPQNLIRRQDGRIFLVDFGAVQMVYRASTTMGSTVVGTYGYMAPEQFQGQAYPATDLYGLGATLLNLLTHQDPGNLPQTRLRINFRSHVTLSDTFADWLDDLLEPLIEDRLASASEAIAALTQPRSRRRYTGDGPVARPAPALKRPSGSCVELTRNPGHLSIRIPPVGLHEDNAGSVFHAIFGIGFVVLMLFVDAPFFFTLTSLIASLNFIWPLLYAFAGRVALEIDGDRFTLTRQFFDWKRSEQGATTDFYGAEIVATRNNFQRSAKVISFSDGAHQFGMTLSTPEKVWLLSEIEAFIQDQARLSR